MIDSKDILETALRVLTAWTQGRRPGSADVDILRSMSADPNLPIDELATRITKEATREMRNLDRRQPALHIF